MRRFVPAVVLLVVVAGSGVNVAAHEDHEHTCFGLTPTIVGTRGADRLLGTEGPDVISSGYGHDVVYGLGGDDLICGGIFDDLLIGGDGNDSIWGGPGSDTVVGGAGDDTSRRGEVVFGGEGNDVIMRMSAAFPGPGDDVIRTNRLGFLNFRFATGPVQVDMASGTATGEGTDQFEGITYLTGSNFDDTLLGNELHNFIYGLDGNDTIRGFDLPDQIDGGPGDDDLDGGSADGPADYDTVWVMDSPVGAAVSLRDGSSAGPGTDTLVDFENVWGSAYDDLLEGDDAANLIVALLGRDEVYGFDGDDQLHGGISGDAGAGTDRCLTPGIANCEEHIVADPYPSSRITSPLHYSTVPASSFDSVESQEQGGLGPPVERIQVALMSMNADGCRWWNRQRAGLVERACTRRLWNSEIETGGTLPPGYYVAFARAILENRDRSGPHTAGQDIITFFLE